MRDHTTTTRGPAPGTVRNPRKLVPPRDKAKRRRYYGLMGTAKKSSGAQRLHLLQLARGLMEWVEVDPCDR